MRHRNATKAGLPALALIAILGAAQAVTPPPLPPGSQKVKIEPGVRPPERNKDDHRRPQPGGHPKQHKNFNVDDSDRSRPDSAPLSAKEIQAENERSHSGKRRN